MKKIILSLLLLFIAIGPAHAEILSSDLSVPFSKLSAVQKSLNTLGSNISEAAGADTEPDRIYAMQDMANMCKVSATQVHSLNSLFSVVNLVKGKDSFKKKEADMLKSKCGYAFNDISRRKTFVKDILAKAKDQTLKDLAKIFEAQLNIVLKQLSKINKNFNK